jgi:hypothetical protein
LRRHAIGGHDSVDLVSPPRDRSMCCSLLHRDAGSMLAYTHWPVAELLMI